MRPTRNISNFFGNLRDGLGARWEGLQHLLRGHDLLWRGNCIDLWTGHTGCIICRACPDSHIEDGEHVGIVFWSRHWPWIWWIARQVCAWQGHDERRRAQRYAGEDAQGNLLYEDVPNEWYCYRCGTDVGPPL